MTFFVCPRCASPEFGAVPTNVDAFDMIYSTNKSYCRSCGFEGIPLIFEDDLSYREFLKTLPERSEEPRPLYGMSAAFDEESERSRFAAAVLSFFLPGLGQAYNAQRQKAWCFFISFVLLFYLGGGYLISFSMSSIFGGLYALDLPMVLYVVFWLYAVSDAFLSAPSPKPLEEEESVEELDNLIMEGNSS